jgi:hypothetical protein
MDLRRKRILGATAMIASLCGAFVNFADASQYVRRSIIQRTYQPSLSTTIYAQNDQLGAGASVINMGGSQTPQRRYTLHSATVLDTDARFAGAKLFFFDQDPGITSADNAALNFSDRALANSVLAVAHLPTSYCHAYAGGSACSITDPTLVGQVLNVPAFSSSLYVVALTQGPTTYTATSSLQFKLKFIEE